MTNSFYINMSLNLRRTKLFFLTFAILSFMIIFISYNWNIPENIYKISSEISKVRISKLQLKDIRIREHTLKAFTREVTKELTNRYVTNESTTKKESETKRDNVTKLNYVESINKEDGENATKDVRATGKVKQESQGNKTMVAQHTTKDFNQTQKVKEKSLQKQTTNSQFINTTSMLSNKVVVDNQKLISKIDNQNLILNATKNNFERTETSKVDTKQVLREIHKLKDEIAKDHKTYKAHKSRYQVLRKNNSNMFKTDRDYQGLHIFRNRLKQLGRVDSMIPLHNTGLNLDNNINGDVTGRPDVCEGCFKSRFKKIINEPSLCDGDVDLLFVITSTFSRKDSRNAIRNTWCKQCNRPDSKMKMVFVFGNRNKTNENENLVEESKQYHDIIQLDFHDTYANLTYKTMSSLQWSEDYCKKAKYVMKTDDDMYVNTELLPLMLKAAPNNNLIGGMCWGPSSPHRDFSSKWYVSFVQYRHSFFPSMCSGTGYVMSRDVVSGILRESPNVPFFYLEDVYVAICVKRLGVTPLLLDGFKNQRVDMEPCIYRNRIITAHELNADNLNYIWDHSRTCPKENLRPEMIYRPFPV